MSKNDEWEQLFQKLVNNDGQPQQKPSTTAGVGGLIVVMAIISVLAAMIMLANMVIESAWPNLTALSPGIGYLKSLALATMMWIFFVAKTTIKQWVESR